VTERIITLSIFIKDRAMKQLRLSNEEISGLCLGLYMLIHSGIGSGDALALMAEDESKKEYKELLQSMAKDADCGMPLAEVFSRTGAFPQYVCGLLETGERTGRTEEALDSLAKYYEDWLRLERQVRSALLYPAVLLLVMLVVIAVLLVKVLPVFDQVYAQLGSSLTGVAGGLLAFGQALKAAMPVLCLLLGAAVLFLAAFGASAGFRDRVLAVWRRSFGNKGVSEKINMARVAQALAMGIGSGLSMEEALDQAASLVEDVPDASRRCRACASALADGMPLAQALWQNRVLPQAECRLLEAGIKGGAPGSAMAHIASRMLEDSEDALAEKVGLVEPAMIIVTSVLIGLILLSVMLPLMEIMTAIG